MAWIQLGKGYLNKNEQATDENKQPHWKGTVDFEGRDISIAGWVRQKDGTESMYFAFSEMVADKETPSKGKPKSEELPF